MHTIKWLIIFIRPIDGTKIGTTTLEQSEPGSNDNKKLLHTLQIIKTVGSPSDSLVSDPRRCCGESVTILNYLFGFVLQSQAASIIKQSRVFNGENKNILGLNNVF